MDYQAAFFAETLICTFRATTSGNRAQRSAVACDRSETFSRHRLNSNSEIESGIAADRRSPRRVAHRSNSGTCLASLRPGRAMREGMTARRVWEMTKASVGAWRADRASSMGGALAYYTLFSIAPVLIIAIAVAGFVFGEEAARGEIATQLRGLLGDEGARAVQGLLQTARRPTEGVFTTLVSVGVLAVGATSVFAELQSDLDVIWKAE